MKTDLLPKIGERKRFFIQISEFSFAAYPVKINHVFRCLPDTAKLPNQSCHLRQNMLSRQICRLFRRECGKPTAARAAGTISLEQADL